LSAPNLVEQKKPISTLVMLTSAPTSAAPCSSMTAPRTAAVVTYACVATTLQRISTATQNKETSTRVPPNDCCKLENRIFIRLPLRGKICSRFHEHEIFASTNSQKMHTPRPPHH